MQEQPSSPQMPPTEPMLPPVEPQSVAPVTPVSAPSPVAPVESAPFEPPVEVPSQAMPTAQPAQSAAAAIEWQASEYITREKNTLWFVFLGVAAVVLAALALFLIKDITFAILIVVMAVAVGLFARRPARDLSYRLSYDGLTINEKFFAFQDYRAFGVVQEGALYSITLLPRKRFAPGVNVYFPPDQGEQIVDMFGAVLPMEHIKQDFIDRLSEKLHF